ncbi:MAG: S41 family peptidase, partial [Chloroflexota bacterium]
PGGAAARAGLRLGDQIISMNGHPITGDQFATTIDPPVVAQVRLVVRRRGLARPLIITITADPFRDQAGNSSTGSLLGLGSRTVGYVDLQWAPGGPAPAGQERWTDQTQGVIRSLDHAGACGWMVDLRDTSSGDLWSYLAALGPLLNPGVKGGFANPDGTHDSWSYRAGKVYWDGVERLGADVLSGPAYTLRRSRPPIAVLTDSTTLSAGELIAIMFTEHSPSRRFGEPTAGSPNEVMGTTLSDGAILAASIASGVDNQGTVYGNHPLAPDQFVSIDWGNRGGSLRDPVVRAAANWLATQSACRR